MMLGTPSSQFNVGRRRLPVRGHHSDAATALPPLTVDMAFVAGLLSGVRSNALRRDALLECAGIEPAALQRAGAHVTVGQYATLMRALMDLLDDEMVGLLQRPAKRGSFPLQARLAVNAPTLGVAIRHVAHASRLLYDDFALTPALAGGLAGVQLVFTNPGASNHHAHETLLRCYWRLFAWLVGNRLPVLRFDFAFPRPAYAPGYARIFPARWRFDAEHSALWFDAALLQQPTCRDEAALRRFLATLLDNMILPPRDMGVAGRVRLHLERTRPAWPDLEATARMMAFSPSTLQRRLAAEGTSFKALRDQLRRELAIQLLHSGQASLATLAGELGFADSFTFQRAFKAWTGSPPGVYRRCGR